MGTRLQPSREAGEPFQNINRPVLEVLWSNPKDFSLKVQLAINLGETPGPSSYKPKKRNLKKNYHDCTMTKTARASWIDRIHR